MTSLKSIQEANSRSIIKQMSDSLVQKNKTHLEFVLMWQRTRQVTLSLWEFTEIFVTQNIFPFNTKLIAHVDIKYYYKELSD